MYINIPTKKIAKILMLRALNTAINESAIAPFDVVQPSEFQATFASFEEIYTAYKFAKKDSETSRQKRDLLIRDIEKPVKKMAQYLKVKHRGNEKAIADWGFPINLGKRSGEIARNRKAENNILLYQQIVAKHTLDGENSILSNYNMTDFEAKMNTIVEIHNNCKQNRTLARIYSKQHLILLDDLMTMAKKIARNLRMREDMEPKDLEAFGFTVNDSYAGSKKANDEDPIEGLDVAS